MFQQRSLAKVTNSADFSKQGVDITEDMHVGEDFLEVGAGHMQIAPESIFWSEPRTLQTIRENSLAAWSSLWLKGVWVVREARCEMTHCWHTARLDLLWSKTFSFECLAMQN